MKLVYKKLKIFSTHFLHFGRGIEPIEIELNRMEPCHIMHVSNWKTDTQDECYLYKITIKIVKVMSGSSENHKVHYNPRAVTKPPEQLQRLVFQFIE